MTARTPIPQALAGGPFATRTALEHVSERVLSGPAFRQVLRGVHAPAGQELDHGDLIRAARLVPPPHAVLGGRSALWAWGVPLAAPEEPVEVVLPPTQRVRVRAQVRVRGDVLLAAEVAASPWGPVTTPARTAFDLARTRSLRRSVALLDALARATGLRPDDVARVAHAHPGARGLSRLPLAVAEMDDAAESVRESELRLLLVGAGLPRPVVQHVVRDAAGRFVARVDLAWPDLRLAVEYDGGHHDDPSRIASDRRRVNALQSCGWSVLVIDRTQFRDEARVVGQVPAMLLAAPFRRNGA